MPPLKVWLCKLLDCEHKLTLIGTGYQLSEDRLALALRCSTKGQELLAPIPLLPKAPQPCFASNRAQEDFYDRIWFSRIRFLTYYLPLTGLYFSKCVRQSG